MAKRIKSTDLHRNTRNILDEVRAGETVIVELYGKPIATITPFKEPEMSITVTPDHIRDLASAEFTNLPVLVIDTDGQVEVFPESTATERGAQVIYDADRLDSWTDGTALTDSDAAFIAAEVNTELRNR